MLLPILFLYALQLLGQRVPSVSGIRLSSPSIDMVQSSPGLVKTFAISGGDFSFRKKDRVSFHAVSVRTLDAQYNHFQKNTMGLAGFSIVLFRKHGLALKALVSQGFNMRQGIVYFPRKENVQFEGLVPVYSFGMSAEYTLNKHVRMFVRGRWIGGDITHLGQDDFSFGKLVLHTGICCKIFSSKS